MASAAIPAAAPAAPERADLAAWLAVAAGTLGALMATLDASIVNSALPTIQGEIGATGSEGTWIATSFLVAEIVTIPMTGWFERVLGLRTLLLIAAGMFTAFSLVCGSATTLMMMIVGRVGQGAFGGILIPTAQTIIATRLPRRQQPIGSTLFGVTAMVGPLLGPIVGGWLTENVSWHYAFFLNLPICAILILLLLTGLPHNRPRFDLLGQADWAGVAGLTLGLGGLTVFLEEGQREQWFESGLIRAMAALTVIGFALLLTGQLRAERPVIRLKLLLDRQVGSLIMFGFVLGMVLFGTAYVIPQFLALIAGYDALQSGQVVVLAGLPALGLVTVLPRLIRRLDLRLVILGALAVMALSSFIDAQLTADSRGNDFLVSQLLRGASQTFAMLFLSQSVIASVPASSAADAVGLFNLFRNLGGSIALASIATIHDQRLWFHTRRLEESLNAGSVAVQDYVDGLAQSFGGEAAMRMIAQQVHLQALTMTFNDIFWILSVATLSVIPLIVFLKPLGRIDERVMVH